jgi:hypothetical protein
MGTSFWWVLHLKIPVKVGGGAFLTPFFFLSGFFSVVIPISLE